jgi:hypothetical protein
VKFVDENPRRLGLCEITGPKIQSRQGGGPICQALLGPALGNLYRRRGGRLSEAMSLLKLFFCTQVALHCHKHFVDRVLRRLHSLLVTETVICRYSKELVNNSRMTVSGTGT